jgi:hypothetical protein
MVIRQLLLCVSLCALGVPARTVLAADGAPLTFDAIRIGKPNSGAQAELGRPKGAGFSHGGNRVLEAVKMHNVPADRGGRAFAAAVGYNPVCETLVAGKASMPHAPQIKVYPNAVPVFDGKGVPHLVVDQDL